jgi:predicted ATP-grasp superfamily ATP-dependent carboligase
MNPDDLNEIELDDEQLTAIAKPFAHVAINSTFLTKHGRAILDSKDAVEAAVIMFMWMGRVNRIAKRYRPRHQKPERKVENGSVDSGQDVSKEQDGYFAAPAVGAGFN